ncbi:MAG TPA: hypothetical protein VFQ57_07660 [Sphingomonas sp.]|jgi:hypothetical protein|nr:hypothetical protein [Sphingomonas sp.]
MPRGEPQRLTRSLGLTAVLFLTLSVATPASSVFVMHDAPRRIAPMVTLAASGYVVVTSWFDLAEGRPGLLMTGAQIVASLAYYRFVLRPRGTWEMKT